MLISFFCKRAQHLTPLALHLATWSFMIDRSGEMTSEMWFFSGWSYRICTIMSNMMSWSMKLLKTRLTNECRRLTLFRTSGGNTNISLFPNPVGRTPKTCCRRHMFDIPSICSSFKVKGNFNCLVTSSIALAIAILRTVTVTLSNETNTAIYENAIVPSWDIYVGYTMVTTHNMFTTRGRIYGTTHNILLT